MESADLGKKYADVSEGGSGKKLSVALLSVNKKEYNEYTVCSSECTVEKMEQYEHADSLVMKNGGLSVAQPSVCVDMNEDKVCGVTSMTVVCQIWSVQTVQ